MGKLPSKHPGLPTFVESPSPPCVDPTGGSKFTTRDIAVSRCLPISEEPNSMNRTLAKFNVGEIYDIDAQTISPVVAEINEVIIVEKETTRRLITNENPLKMEAFVPYAAGERIIITLQKPDAKGMRLSVFPNLPFSVPPITTVPKSHIVPVYLTPWGKDKKLYRNELNYSKRHPIGPRRKRSVKIER